jgi:hypothetical protein
MNDDQPTTTGFSEYHIKLCKGIEDVGQELDENEKGGRSNMTVQICLSKIEGLKSMC